MNETEKDEKIKTVKLEDTKEIELPTLDVEKHIGKKVKIEEVTEKHGEFGYFVDVRTEILETIKANTPEKDDIELRASQRFGLQEVDGQVGWGKDTKLGVFLKSMKVKHYNELIGKTVIVQTTLNKKDGKKYLSF